jgi:outer membrane protein
MSMKWLSGLLLCSVVAAAGAADLKIGIVSLERLMAEAPAAKAASEALNKEFSAKGAAITSLQNSLKAKEEKLTKDKATMSGDQISKMEKELRDGNRDLQSRSTEFQDDLTARQQEEYNKVQETLGTAIAGYAASQNYDLVLYQGIAYVNPALDMTAAVLANLIAGGARPATSPAPRAPATK